MDTASSLTTALSLDEIKHRISQVPNVLDVVIADDFEHRTHWQIIIDVLGYKFAPAVRIDVYRQLVAKHHLTLHPPQATCKVDGTEEAEQAFSKLNAFIADLKKRLPSLLTGSKESG